MTTAEEAVLPGIPSAVFIEDVEKFLNGHAVDEFLHQHKENHTKYKRLEEQLLRDRARIQQRIPDLTANLQILTHLIEKKDAGESVETTFEVTTGYHASAVIDNPEKVGLWLGANVMVEYKIEEAVELLQGNLKTAETNLELVHRQLDFIKDQLTTTEVNMARLYNYEVLQKRKGRK